jgi:hypothetical protein
VQIHHEKNYGEAGNGLLHTGSEHSEQTFELLSLSLSGAQWLDRIGSVALPKFECPDSTVRRPAVLVEVQGVTVIEEGEAPTINLHGHKSVIDLIP